MCLEIKTTSRQETANLIKYHRRTNTPIIAYKLFEILDGNLIAPYQQTHYSVNSLQISNRTCSMGLLPVTKRYQITKLTKREKEMNEVNYGIHAILNLNDAKLLYQSNLSYVQLANQEPVSKSTLDFYMDHPNNHKETSINSSNLEYFSEYFRYYLNKEFTLCLIHIDPRDVIITGQWFFQNDINDKTKLLDSIVASQVTPIKEINVKD